MNEFLRNLIYDDAGKISPAKLATAGAGLAALYGVAKPDSGIGRFMGTSSNQRPVGYTGGIPEYGIARTLRPDAFLNYPDKDVSTFVNKTYGQYGGPGAAANKEIAKAMNQYGVLPDQVARVTGFTPEEVAADYKAFGYGTPATEPAVIGQRRPGSGGRRYFTDTTYTPTGKTMSSAINPVNVPAQTQTGGGTPTPTPTPTPAPTTGGLFDSLTKEEAMYLLNNLFGEERIPLAQGGAVPASRGYYLGGSTDGMADEIPATIENTQPAALSDGEFVVPADVVSGLGNGNSDAGAKVLYSMMDRVRQARTGTKEQGRKITPNKFTPA
jgi:hypothetical protein